mgnify:CR=1 FL=1
MTATPSHRPSLTRHPVTPDERYFVFKERLWRMANPELAHDERASLVRQLMTARRAIAAAKKLGDERAVRQARAIVDRTKRALGERGPTWWKNGTPDSHRCMVRARLMPSGSLPIVRPSVTDSSPADFEASDALYVLYDTKMSWVRVLRRIDARVATRFPLPAARHGYFIAARSATALTVAPHARMLRSSQAVSRARRGAPQRQAQFRQPPSSGSACRRPRNSLDAAQVRRHVRLSDARDRRRRCLPRRRP